jgi:ketosteroid isomerase-like protein
MCGVGLRPAPKKIGLQSSPTFEISPGVRHCCASEINMRQFLLAVLLLSPVLLRAQQSSEIQQVLSMQAEAWNHHDLDRFMKGYWNSPELTFFSGAKASLGWQAALERYRKSYQSEGHEMGHLDFSDLKFEPLGSDAAFVRGTWKLTLSDGKTPHGLFTLVFRKFPDGWKIIHDHSSAAE